MNLKCPMPKWNSTERVKEECAWWFAEGMSPNGSVGKCAVLQLAKDINNKFFPYGS